MFIKLTNGRIIETTSIEVADMPESIETWLNYGPAENVDMIRAKDVVSITDIDPGT